MRWEEQIPPILPNFMKKKLIKWVAEAEQIFLKATKQVILDQEECGIDIITDGEVRRENYIHYHCRHLRRCRF